MQPENKLITQIAAGDESALRALYEIYYPRLARFLLRVTNDREHIVEIINDVFLAVWRGADGFRGDSNVSTWILGIAYNKGLKHMSRQRKVPLDWRAGATFDNEHDRIDHQRDTRQLLAELSPEQRAVFELTYYFGYSYSEIGDILNCPENTVKTRMFHGRKKLRALAKRNFYV